MALLIMSPMSQKLRTLLLGGAIILVGCHQQDAETQPRPLKLSQAEQAPSLEPPQTGAALKDFANITEVSAKKRAFFDYLQPQIEFENRHIDTLKAHFSTLQKLLKQQGQLHPTDADWLNQAASLYRVDAADAAQQLATLNLKLGEIPAALVKAQAANESAWGTSRFAREANNLFGQWCFSPGCGIAPLQRNPDDTHEVQSFPSVAAGLRSYFVNLNSHKGYASLRQIRRCLQTHKQSYSGRALAAGLVNYSARGGHYVDELQSMIRINKLESWESNWWGESNPDHPCYSLVQVQVDHPDPVKVIAETETMLLLTEQEPRVIVASAAQSSSASAAQPSSVSAAPASSAPAAPASSVSAAEASSTSAAPAVNASAAQVSIKATLAVDLGQPEPQKETLTSAAAPI